MNHIGAASKFHKKILHFWWKMNNIFCFWLQGSILEVVCIVLQMDGTNVERCLSTLFQIQRYFWTLVYVDNTANVNICCVLKQSVCLQPSPEGTCLSHQELTLLRENKSMQMNEWKLGHQIAASKRQCGFHYMVTCHEKIVVAHSRESSRHPVWMEMLGFCLRPM